MTAIAETRLTDAFDLLTHPFRRYTLNYLSNESGVVGIDTLATAIATWDADSSEPNQSNETNQITIALHHTHLPKLDDAGIIAFDAKTGSIGLRETGGLDQFLANTSSIDGDTHAPADD